MEDLAMEIPGRAVAGSVMEEVMEIAWWRINLNKVWKILAGDKKLQKVISCRMDFQRMEELWRMEMLQPSA